ncbi:hypothetical protein GCM10010172_40280 [Paractinoplanes ferrugineus]|uniref:Uncharacterized protein n=1 Tax=Paractinoplanes ferrugineus TaxID=113564 RepID=A0A919JAH3_9ACTN|nr:hypothetical protein Afe05nite_79030 [Actinoplanes ferrugineus]
MHSCRVPAWRGCGALGRGVPGLAVAAFFTGFTLPGAGAFPRSRRPRAGPLVLAPAVVLIAAGDGGRHPESVGAGTGISGLVAAARLVAAFFLVPWGRPGPG